MTNAQSRLTPRLVADSAAVDARNPTPQKRGSLPPIQNSYLAGEVIGDRYRLVRELGSGGMGVVWVAHSLVLGVDVALKMIRASAAGPGIASRMAREAHAAARLGHPALVRVFDFGWTSRGDPFLVMELVLGETLAAILEREGRVDAIRAVQMILPIADGLRVAHDKQIVHRDIKPENIFVATDGLGRSQPKLLDFGIAKIDAAAVDGKLTQVGAPLGSPAYMSPEQALGVDDIDERTDVWSLCVVLYELISGKVPFSKPNFNALMQSIIHDNPTPLPELAAGDGALWLVVERGLAKDREERWSTMSELGEALALWLYERGIKEDLSGNSVRAVWLDAALSGVRTELPGSLQPQKAHRALESATIDGTSPRLAQSMSATLARLRSKRQKQAFVMTLAAGIGIGAVVAAVAVRITAKAQPPTPPAASSPLPIKTTPATPPTPTGTAAPTQPAVSATAWAEQATTAPPARLRNNNPPSNRKPTAPKASPAPSKATPKKIVRDHDFGF